MACLICSTVSPQYLRSDRGHAYGSTEIGRPDAPVEDFRTVHSGPNRVMISYPARPLQTESVSVARRHRKPRTEQQGRRPNRAWYRMLYQYRPSPSDGLQRRKERRQREAVQRNRSRAPELRKSPGQEFILFKQLKVGVCLPPLHAPTRVAARESKICSLACSTVCGRKMS